MKVLETPISGPRVPTLPAGKRHVVIVAPQFPPSNLTAGHRTRLFARHLPALGFRTTVLTVDPAYYEEPLDEELTQLVQSEVRVLRTAALPTRPVRLIGDLGIRSFWFHYRAVARLVREDRIDLIYIPIPPNYSALLGPLLKRRFGIPYVIDYIDPWIYPITNDEKKSWKARLSHWLARRLEPLAVEARTASRESLLDTTLKCWNGIRICGPFPRLAFLRRPMPKTMPTSIALQRRSQVLDTLDLGNSPYLPMRGCAAMPVETLRVLFEGCRRLRDRRPRWGTIAPPFCRHRHSQRHCRTGCRGGRDRHGH